MKIIAIGDIHGKNSWMNIIRNESFDKLVFMGDYFDSFTIPYIEQMNNFLQILKYKQLNKKRVVLLFGNHDYHYLSGINQHYSGYQSLHALEIGQIISSAIKGNLMQLMFYYGEVFFTHAGLSKTWLEDNGLTINKPKELQNTLNLMLKYRPITFKFNYGLYCDECGDNNYQGPLWIRPSALKEDNYDSIKNKYIQIVGHTSQSCIDIKGKSTGGRYYFVDTLDTSKEYLIYEDGEFKVNTL